MKDEMELGRGQAEGAQDEGWQVSERGQVG